MSSREYLKLNGILEKNQFIKPKTYIDELAESGLLDEYLDEFFKNKVDYDYDFKERVYDAFYHYSQDINENLELYYLEQICESLSFFIEYTERCRTQKQ